MRPKPWSVSDRRATSLGPDRHVFCRQSLNYRRHRIFCQVTEESVHRVDSLPAGRTPRYNDPFPTLRHRRRLIYEITEVVTVDFLLDCAEQRGFLHGPLQDEEEMGD